MRATSTVVDAAVFALLVGAAVATLAVTPAEPPAANDDVADGTADALATSTASIEYSLGPGARRADSAVASFPRTGGPRFRRTAHGTLASHLATAALGNLSVDGTRVSPARLEYERAVANATGNVTRGRDHLVRIVAVWEPYRDAPLAGRFRVGPRPPTSSDVHAATLSVASGAPTASERARSAAANGTFADVGHAVARSVVDGLFPRSKTRSALRDGYPVEQLVTYRYERLGLLLGTNVTDRAVADDVAGANDRLTDALGDRFAADMGRRFESPSDAAATVSTAEVEITVRAWSP